MRVVCDLSCAIIKKICQARLKGACADFATLLKPHILGYNPHLKAVNLTKRIKMENNYIRTLGIDIGIASIGWALIEDRGEIADSPAANPKHDIQIIDSGVRIFTRAENPKDKSSLALPRRLARSARKSTRRKRNRILQVKKYLAHALNLELEALLGESDRLSPIFQTSKEFVSPWQLRVDALDRRLEDSELARVILHIAKRRGYDDVTYGMGDDGKNGVIVKAVRANHKLRDTHGYRTIGEMLCKSYFMSYREGSKDYDNVRNRTKKATTKKDGYKRCVGRSELRDELEKILSAQERLGNPRITPELKARLLGDPAASSKDKKEGLIFYQRPLKSFEDKIGYCIHLPKEKRAPKGSVSAERFVALTRIINTLRYISKQEGIVWDTPALIKQILEEAQKLKSGVTYAKLRTILRLPETFEFRELRYIKDKNFITLECTHKLQAANPDLPIATQDKIATILSANKDWNVIKGLLEDFLAPEQVANIKEAKLNFSHRINISLRALEHLLPLMEQGVRYDEAVSTLVEQGIFPPQVENKMKLLPPLSEAAKEDSYLDINNPVVTRAVSEFRKVLNAVIEKHGKLHYCNVELAREVGASKDRREEYERAQKENATANAKAAEELARELGITNPSASDILRAKLWIQQDNRCIYSGVYIHPKDLLNGNKVNIDHALPRAYSFDNSQSNKVLCLSGENQRKGNRTPWEWLKDDPERWAAFTARVDKSSFSPSKKNKIKTINFKKRQEGFTERALNDTRHISRAISLYLKRYLDFAPIEGKKHVRICTGALTSALRRHWGLEEKDRSHHLHHAQDAIVIACVNDATISAYNSFLINKGLSRAKKEEKEEAIKSDYKTRTALRQPTPALTEKVKESLAKIQVSHHSSHKITGALHKDTVYKKKDSYGEYGGKEGLQKAVELGNIREINGGIVKNHSMPRVDVFRGKSGKNKDKFYVVPIYTFDFAAGRLPNKAIVSSKKGEFKDWLEMDEDYEFCFSLFKNDAVRIQTNKMEKPVIAIYRELDSSNGAMDFHHHSSYAFANDDEKKFFTRTKNEKDGRRVMCRESCGIQGLKHFSKVSISPIGELKELKPSKRQWLQNKDSKKNPKNV